MTVADLREYAAFNLDFMNAVREEKKAGKTAEEIAAAWTIPAKYKGYATPELKSNAAVVLAEVN